MPRTAKPALEKVKDQAIELTPDELEELGTWIEDVAKIREADRRRTATNSE